MVFYTVILGITELSAFLMQIGQDLRKIEGSLRVLCVCWRESSLMEELETKCCLSI